jgi:hypothetical protein
VLHCSKLFAEKGNVMPHTHTKAEAIHDAIEGYQAANRHAPDAHEKARLISDTVKQWEHEEVEILHAADHPQN